MVRWDWGMKRGPSVDCGGPPPVFQKQSLPNLKLSVPVKEATIVCHAWAYFDLASGNYTYIY